MKWKFINKNTNNKSTKFGKVSPLSNAGCAFRSHCATVVAVSKASCWARVFNLSK